LILARETRVLVIKYISSASARLPGNDFSIPIEGMCQQTFHGTEKPLRYDRMSGLDSEQLDELVLRIEKRLDEPRDKVIGRPRDVTLREAVIIACGYMRQNIIQEVWAEIFDTSQPVISGIIAKFTPLVEAATEVVRLGLLAAACRSPGSAAGRQRDRR
jgi:hypothetical protein